MTWRHFINKFHHAIANTFPKQLILKLTLKTPLTPTQTETKKEQKEEKKWQVWRQFDVSLTNGNKYLSE